MKTFISFLCVLTCFIALTPALAVAQVAQVAPAIPTSTMLERSQSAFGLVTFTLLSFVIGRGYGARSKIPWRLVGWGLGLQILFGVIVIYSPKLLEEIQYAIQKLLDYTLEGSRLVFGNLGAGAGVPAPVTVGDNPGGAVIGFAQVGSFAFGVLPTIIFVSMLTAMLYHIGVLTWVVKAFAWVMQKTMGTSGAETLSAAANILVGQTEAPLIVKPFLATATKSELMAVMVGGFANIASGVLVVYTGFLKDYIQNVGGHLAAACFISAPASLVVAKLMIPETTTPVTAGTVHIKVEKPDANLLDAATRGTSEGLALAINVGAMLIARAKPSLVPRVAASSWFATLTHLDTLFDANRPPKVTLELIFGWVMSPFAWLCGIPWSECPRAGSLLGIKTVLNEFVAYLQLGGAFGKDRAYLSPRSALITVYALCGFANFASVGIQIGGIGIMAPTRRSELSKIALLAMVGGAISSFMTACVVGILI